MIDILNVHLEEIKDNIKSMEKSILRQITDSGRRTRLGVLTYNDNMSFRILHNDCVKLEHTLECLKEIVKNIKSKNNIEWTARQHQ